MRLWQRFFGTRRPPGSAWTQNHPGSPLVPSAAPSPPTTNVGTAPSPPQSAPTSRTAPITPTAPLRQAASERPGLSWVQDAQAAIERGDYRSAFDLIHPKAHQGDAEAQYMFGSLSLDKFVSLYLETGNHEYVKYVAEGVEWLRKAAETGHSKAQAQIAGAERQLAACKPSFQDNGDGTVTDLRTGLVWQGGHPYKSGQFRYSDAVANAKTCSTGGFKDWRLPTKEELQTLWANVETSPANRKIIDVGFTDYWSSSRGEFRGIWCVNFERGSPCVFGDSSGQYVRYVRSEALVAADLKDEHKDVRSAAAETQGKIRPTVTDAVQGTGSDQHAGYIPEIFPTNMLFHIPWRGARRKNEVTEGQL